MVRIQISCAVALALAAPAPAAAQIAIPVHEVPADRVTVDGALRDWRNIRMVSVGSGADAAMRFALGYDGRGLYVAADVADDRLIRLGDPGREQDAVVVTLAIPDGRSFRGIDIWLYPGEPGRSAAIAAIGATGARRPQAVREAEVVEGPRSGGPGWIIEAHVPWSAIGAGPRWQEGRLAVRLRDVDREARPTVEAEPGTAPVDPAALDRLPAIQATGGEQGLLRSFSMSREIEAATPRFDLRGNVAGDRRPERVVLVDRYLVVLGAGYRNGQSYSFLDLPGVRNAQDLRAATLVDLTGDGLAELALSTRQHNELGSRDLWQAISFATDSPSVLFAVEVRKETRAGSVEAALRVRPGRRGTPATVEVRTGTAHGLDAQTLREGPAPGVEPMLLPWGPVRARSYRWDGTRFATLEEERNPDFVAPVARTATARPPEPEPEPLPGSEQILAAFRAERGIAPSVRPRFRRRANIAEDRRLEEAMVFGHALVVLGAGYRGGRGYFYFELPVASDDDLLDLRAEDVTGDGVAEILAKLRQHIGDVDREVLVVHQLQPRAFPRILSVEVARARGRDRVQNEIRFVGAGRGRAIEIRPGTARGWNAESYPFARSEEAGVASLLLPWSDQPVRWMYDGRTMRRTDR